MFKYNMSQRASDKLMGNMNEKKVLKYLNEKTEFINDNFKLHKNQWATIDFVNSNYVAELKSRRCYVRSYPDTMCGLNKIKYAEDHPEKNVVFYFLYQDGLYKWDYNKDQYSIRGGGRNDRERDERKDYGYILIEHLELITNEISSVIRIN